MNGISNQLSAEDEISQNEAAIRNFDTRIIETGKIPGTHSLGIKFRTCVEEKNPLNIVPPTEEEILSIIEYAMNSIPNWDQLARQDIENRNSGNLRRIREMMRA